MQYSGVLLIERDPNEVHVSRAIIILSLHIDSLPAISIVSASPFYRTIPTALFPREIVEYARGIYVHTRQAIQQRTIENSDGPFVL